VLGTSNENLTHMVGIFSMSNENFVQVVVLLGTSNKNVTHMVGIFSMSNENFVQVVVVLDTSNENLAHMQHFERELDPCGSSFQYFE
jgi:hypothetical protein